MKDQELNNILKQCEREMVIKMLRDEVGEWDDLLKYCSYLTNDDERDIKNEALIERRKYLYESIKADVPIGGKIGLWLNSDHIEIVEGNLCKIHKNGITINIKYRKFFKKHEELHYFEFDEIDMYGVPNNET